LSRSTIVRTMDYIYAYYELRDYILCTTYYELRAMYILQTMHIVYLVSARYKGTRLLPWFQLGRSVNQVHGTNFRVVGYN